MSSIQAFFAVVFPWLNGTGRRRMHAPLLWMLHVLLWIGLTAGLWQTQHAFGLDRDLHSPLPILHPYWLPLLVALIYVLSWFTAGLWHSLRPAPPMGVWPDVEEPWHGARRLLDQTSSSQADLPLFLIVGSLTSDVKAMLDTLNAAAVLPRAAASLQVYSSPEAIFIVCHQSSSLGMYGYRPRGLATSQQADLASGAARLRHLCQLLRRDRPNGRAVQGIVLMMPLPALQSDTEVRQAAACCGEDLRAIHQATGLDCPLYVAVAGLESAPESVAQGWLQRFAIQAGQAPAVATEMLRQGIDQMCLEQLPRLLRRQLRLKTETGSTSDALRANIRLHRFLGLALTWSTNLARLLADWKCSDRVAGCYFLPTADGQRRSPVPHVLLMDMLALQPSVSWSADMLTQFDRERRASSRGYGLIVACWFTILTAAGWMLVYRL